MTDAVQSGGVVTFAGGIPGFEGDREFVVVASEDLDPFTLVQGIGDGAPAFIAIDPRRVDAGYEAALSDSDCTRLGADGAGTLLWLALVSTRADGPATVNLRAPLVINPETMTGIQVLAVESPYRVDHPLPGV